MEGLVIALFVCLVLLVITKYCSWPVIPFYILAGIALGTSGLKLVAPDAISAFLSELGLIFLLFYMGLEIKPDRILSNQKTFFISGLIDLNINLNNRLRRRICPWLFPPGIACHCLCIFYKQHRDDRDLIDRE